ncbi:MliC family protein [Desulfosarcina sp. OttesenSCG-928-B08]|nr:MliC family protein [Desulfosarcina sp. OttesenSCG-928-B08]
MKKHIVVFLFTAGMVFSLAGCGTTTGQAVSDAAQNARYYYCESGKVVTVIPMSKNSVTVMYGKDPYPMIRGLAASGVRYTGKSREWWEKGSEGTFRNADSNTIIDTCKQNTDAQ